MKRRLVVFALAAIVGAFAATPAQDAFAGKNPLKGKEKVACKLGSIKLTGKAPASTAVYTPFATTHQFTVTGIKPGLTTTTLNLIAHFDLEGQTFPYTVPPQNITVMTLTQTKVKLSDPFNPSIKSWVKDDSSAPTLVITAFDPVTKKVAGTFSAVHLVPGLTNPGDPPRDLKGGKFLMTLMTP